MRPYQTLRFSVALCSLTVARGLMADEARGVKKLSRRSGTVEDEVS
jgi:hypothetical protein